MSYYSELLRKYLKDFESRLKMESPWYHGRIGADIGRYERKPRGIYGQFLSEIREGGDEEEIIRKYVNKLVYGHGGWKREEARRRLLKILEKEKM